MKYLSAILLLTVLYVRPNAVNGIDAFLSNGGVVRCINTADPYNVDLRNCRMLLNGQPEASTTGETYE